MEMCKTLLGFAHFHRHRRHEPKQQNRTLHLLQKPDIFICYRHTISPHPLPSVSRLEASLLETYWIDEKQFITISRNVDHTGWSSCERTVKSAKSSRTSISRAIMM